MPKKRLGAKQISWSAPPHSASKTEFVAIGSEWNVYAMQGSHFSCL
jgi:hypothetical protein